MIPARKSPMLETVFRRYVRATLRRSFHAVHLVGAAPCLPADESLPLLVCINHSSWWDVLVSILAEEALFGWEAYGVMDERQLRRYRFFSRLGLIGVDRTRLSGANEFLDYCENLLRGRRRALWLTPQGAMVSNHARPIRFQPGLGHLAVRLGDFYFTTIALHYEFWDERLPEAFVSLSPIERIRSACPDFNRKAFVRTQEQRLETQLNDLLALVQQRDATEFQPLLRGKTGIHPVYDIVRSLSARLRGERFPAAHGEVLTPQWKSRLNHRDTETRRIHGEKQKSRESTDYTDEHRLKTKNRFRQD